MPRRAPKPCSRCGGLTESRYCRGCQAKAYRDQDAKRGTARQRGYNSKWDQARKGYLAKHPLCVECLIEHREAAATVVDHIQPHRGDMTLFWDSSNWRALCKQHHDRATVLYDGAFGNPRRPKGISA